MSETGFIYGLSDPRTQEIRYVGLTTKRLKERLYHHIKMPTSKKMAQWFNDLASVELQPEIVLLETVPIARLVEREKAWIAHYKQAGHRLLNGNKGGSAGPRSSTGTIKVTMSMPEDLIDRVEYIARREDRTFAQQVIYAMRRFIEGRK